MTFDDGPDPIWTAKLLDRLRRLGARATFFPIAARAAAHPDLIARIIDEGHAVGLHCHEHVRHSERDVDWLREDTRVDLHLADLSTSERLARVGLTLPTPGRRTWPPFEAVGEQLFRAGFAGILAPSAARPQGLISCIFDLGAWPPAGCRPVRAIEINEAPPPPTGMTT